MTRAKAGGLIVGAVLVIVFAIAAATEENPGEILVAGAIGLGVLALYWWLAVVRPSAHIEGNTTAAISLVSGILAGVTMVAWWMGLPLVLGGGAVVLGMDGRDRASRGAGRGTMATVGLALGALAIAVWLFAALSD